MINSRGYIAISSVVIILAVILSITITMSYSAIGEAQSGLALFQGEENLHQVEGCVEDALLKARASATFGDPVTVPVNIARPTPQPTCVVTVNSKGAGPTFTWNMIVSVNTTSSKRNINVIFNRETTGIKLTSWNEF